MVRKRVLRGSAGGVSGRVRRPKQQEMSVPKRAIGETGEEDLGEQPRKKKLTSLLSSMSRRAEAPLVAAAGARGAPGDAGQDQWTEKYAPQHSSEVAIHARKLKDVESAVRSGLGGPQEGQSDSGPKLLVLSGPAGSSKSTIVKLLGTEIVTQLFPASAKPLIEWENSDLSGISSTNSFAAFLDSVKYRTFKNTSLVLVEDLPNLFHEETRASFQNSILSWINTKIKTPLLVLCVTECDFPYDDGNKFQAYNIDSNYSVETILNKRILNHSRVKRIKFNPVNATLIKKCLTKIAKLESLENYESKVLQLSTIGDIRSGISNFQYWSKWGDSIQFGKEESNISIFHAIGKCIFGSKTDSYQQVMANVYKDYLTRSNLLRLGLLENYTNFNKSNFSIETAETIANNLSLSDLIGDQQHSLDCSIRGVRLPFSSISSSSSSTTHTGGLNFPREIKLFRYQNNVRKQIQSYIEIELKRRNLVRTFNDSNLLTGFYEPLINKLLFIKYKSKLIYYQSRGFDVPKELQAVDDGFLMERLGGDFNKEIDTNGEIVTEFDLMNDANFESFNKSNYFNQSRGILGDADSHGDDIDDENCSEFDDDPIVNDSDRDSDSNSDNDTESFGDDTTFERELLNVSQLKRNNSEFEQDFNDDDFSD